VYVGEYLTNGIRGSVMRYVSSDNVRISVSHLHSAPATDVNKPELGVASNLYLESILRLISSAIDNLFRSMTKQVGYIVYREGIASYTINRRKRRFVSPPA